MSKIGLVLGAGGTVGHAYHSGVLAAIEDATGWDPRSAEVIVGTSAGSIVAAYLRAGLKASDLAAASLREQPSPAGARLLARAGERVPLPTPGLQHADLRGGPAAAGLLLRPWGIRLGTLGAALVPEGTVSTEAVAAGVRGVFGTSWPERSTWICAVRLDDGRLIAFGKPGEPTASLADAVAASCAIPGFFRPVLIGGRRHVDGGAHSVTNADLLAGQDLDLVVVSCPMAADRDAVAMGPDALLRVGVGHRLRRELDTVRRSGTPVVVFRPDRAVRAAMGNNPMAARRGRAVTAAARESTRQRLLDGDLREQVAALA